MEQPTKIKFFYSSSDSGLVLPGQGIELVGFPENVEFCYGEDLVLGDPNAQIFLNGNEIFGSDYLTATWLNCDGRVLVEPGEPESFYIDIDNLMDYNRGIKLRKFQWDHIQSQLID